LDGKAKQASLHLQRAGELGRNAAQRWFHDPRNGWPPDQPATIRRKQRRMRGKAKREAAAAIAAGDFSGDTPNIDTAQMRRAITFIVKEDT
jgi:hypothetical protein